MRDFRDARNLLAIKLTSKEKLLFTTFQTFKVCLRNEQIFALLFANANQH